MKILNVHYLPWVLLAVSVISGALGQLFMKAGMLTGWQDYPGVAWIMLGIACYGMAMVVWIYVLAHFELSVAYPLLSLGYVLVYLGAVVWGRLDETFTLGKTLGVLCIMVGVVLIAKPSRPLRAGEKREAHNE